MSPHIYLLSFLDLGPTSYLSCFPPILVHLNLINTWSCESSLFIVFCWSGSNFMRPHFISLSRLHLGQTLSDITLFFRTESLAMFKHNGVLDFRFEMIYNQDWCVCLYLQQLFSWTALMWKAPTEYKTPETRKLWYQFYTFVLWIDFDLFTTWKSAAFPLFHPPWGLASPQTKLFTSLKIGTHPPRLDLAWIVTTGVMMTITILSQWKHNV